MTTNLKIIKKKTEKLIMWNENFHTPKNIINEIKKENLKKHTGNMATYMTKWNTNILKIKKTKLNAPISKNEQRMYK